MPLIAVLTIVIGVIEGIVKLLEWLHEHPEVTAPIAVKLQESRAALSDAREYLHPIVTPPPEAP